MSKLTEEDLKEIGRSFIEDLRECEDGTSVTTWQLVMEAGYDETDFEWGDLFVVHRALFDAARKNHITLDMSAHRDMDEGMPYHLDFIVRNKKAQIKCPHCGSTNTARYIYGYPLFSDKMQKNLDAGKWILGGCGIDSVEMDGKRVELMPTRKCNDCSKDFGKAPILFTPKKNLVEDYRDIVTAIKFSIGGFLTGRTEVTIRKNKDGACVEEMHLFDSNLPTEPKQISKAKWHNIVNKLYDEMYLHEWKKSYVDDSVLDGTQWELQIKLTNNRVRNYGGSNAYPPYYKELRKLLLNI